MEKKIKTGRIIDIYATLSAAKLAKMESADRRRVFAATYAAKKIVDEHNAIRDEAVKKFKSDNYDEEIAPTVDKFNGMTREERIDALKNDAKIADAIKIHTEFVTEVNGVIVEERDKDVELSFTPLSEDAFDKLFDSNENWTVGEAMELHDILCGEENSGKEE